MWPFSKQPTKELLAGHRTVVVNGGRYVIRKINPLIDFPAGRMPQIFVTFQSRRKKQDEDQAKDGEAALRDMMDIVRAGLVEPKLVPEAKNGDRASEEGLTVTDLFRDPDTGAKLYCEIIAHALNRYKGLRGVAFLALTRHTLYTSWRASMDAALVQLPSPTAS